MKMGRRRAADPSAWEGMPASFKIDFQRNQSLPGTPSCTVTRASTGYSFEGGTLTSVAVNEPRFGLNGGLLVEPQRVNICLWSEALSSWGTIYRVTVSDDQIAAPDGATTADKVTETTDGSTHGLRQTFTGTAAVHGGSIFAKAGERSRTELTLFDGTAEVANAKFDLLTGTILENSLGTAWIENYGSGWWRPGLAGTLAASAGCEFNARLIESGTTTSYTGDGTSGLYLWGGQVEQGDRVTSYIKTTSSAVTRSADLPELALAGWDSGGTIYIEFIPRERSNAARILTVSKTTREANNEASCYMEGYAITNSRSRSLRAFVTSGGTTVAPDSTVVDGAFAWGSISKLTQRIEPNNFAVWVDGVLAHSDTSGAIPQDIAKLWPGHRGDGANHQNIEVLRLAGFPPGLSDAWMARLTS